MASQAGGQLGGVAKEASIIPVRWTEHDESKGEVEALFESLQWILNDVIRNGKQGKSVINFSGGESERWQGGVRLFRFYHRLTLRNRDPW
jgi:hypothetical protein